MELPSDPVRSAMSRRRAAASFLLLDEPQDLDQIAGDQALLGRKHHPATCFGGHGHEQTHTDEAKNVAGDLGQFVSNPTKIADTAAWAKLMSDVAVLANFGALILTFLGAAYHAYGYVQFRNAEAQKQASGRSSGGHH
ncbi:unnamed protein product [Effrenium voratum]|nr:unnamed protein product [Effrenium voratum]